MRIKLGIAEKRGERGIDLFELGAESTSENHLGRKELKIFNRKQKSGNKNSTKNRAVEREG